MNAEAIRNCKKNRNFSHCAFMIGIPTETEEDLKKHITLSKRIGLI